MANSVDPDQMLHYAVSDLGLLCLQRPICPNTQGYYGTIIFIILSAKYMLWVLAKEVKEYPQDMF